MRERLILPIPLPPALQLGGLADGPSSGYPVVLHGKEWVLPDRLAPPWLRDALSAAIAGRGDQFGKLADAARTGSQLGTTLPQKQAVPTDATAAGAVTITQYITVSGLNADDIEPRVTAAIRKNNSDILRMVRAR